MPGAVPCTAAITGFSQSMIAFDGADRAGEHHAPGVADDALGRALRPAVGRSLFRGQAAEVGAGAEEATGRPEHDAADGGILVRPGRARSRAAPAAPGSRSCRRRAGST